MSATPRKRRPSDWKRNKALHLMLLLPVIFTIIYKYIPMLGIVIAFENYKRLIGDIIAQTDMQVALIPHVVWAEGDDRIPLQKLHDTFADTGRVVMVDDHNCQTQKYLISRCRFFIGARTHATIAAYSSCVPTLVLGYSVKSRGIARDLFGTEDGYVLSVQNLRESDALSAAFMQLLGQEKQIKTHLEKVIPDIRARANAGHLICV